MSIVGCDYNSFQRSLHEMQELQSAEDLDKSADLLLFDSPYIVCRQQDLQNSDHNVHIAQNMQMFCKFAE